MRAAELAAAEEKPLIHDPRWVSGFVLHDLSAVLRPSDQMLSGWCKLLHLVRPDIDVRPGEPRQAALVGAEVVGWPGDRIVPGVDGGAGAAAGRVRHP